MGDSVRQEWDASGLACARLQNWTDSSSGYQVSAWKPPRHDLVQMYSYNCVAVWLRLCSGVHADFFLFLCSTWVMMNRKTRKLSKMPEEVRAEISPYFLERSAIKDENMMTQKIIRLNGNAECVRSGLTVGLPFCLNEFDVGSIF